MSEAQQYQEIRRHWKKEYRACQRAQSIATEDTTDKPNPVLSRRKDFAQRMQQGIRAAVIQSEASKYARLLNRFKDKTNGQKNIQ